MLSKYKTVFFLLFLVSGIAVQGQKLYKPSLADAQRSGISSDTLMLGRKLYVNNCGSCHSLYMPGQYSEKEWIKTIPEMQMKAKISNQQTLTILNYLKAGAKQKQQ